MSNYKSLKLTSKKILFEDRLFLFLLVFREIQNFLLQLPESILAPYGTLLLQVYCKSVHSGSNITMQ